MFLTIFLATMAIGLLAHWHVRRTYARHNQTPTLSGYTDAEAARQLLREAGIDDVSIVEHDEYLGDHYDPTRKRLVLHEVVGIGDGYERQIALDERPVVVQGCCQ